MSLRYSVCLASSIRLSRIHTVASLLLASALLRFNSDGMLLGATETTPGLGKMVLRYNHGRSSVCYIHDGD